LMRDAKMDDSYAFGYPSMAYGTDFTLFDEQDDLGRDEADAFNHFAQHQGDRDLDHNWLW
jgi:hypothetical protein